MPISDSDPAPFDWEEFLKLAESLILPKPADKTAEPTPEEEARYRTSSSRAYYAAFNLLVEYLERFDPGYDPAHIPKGVGKHDYTINRLNKIRDSKIPQSAIAHVNQMLHRAKDVRHIADYKGNDLVKIADAEFTIENAKASIKLLLDDTQKRTSKAG